MLDRGAVAAGFDNDLWTLARVAEVIEQVTGVAHHPGHVWRILKTMRWSLQRRARKAVEGDEQEIARWVAEEWPRVVQTPNAQSLALFRRRIGRQADPPVRRTWAPKGRTPVLRHRYRRGKQISMCGMVAYRPGQDGHDEPAAWMGFDLLEGTDDTGQFIRVLDGLGHQLGHQPVTVIWDNLGAHHAGDLDAWAKGQPWLVLEYLPSYAPELDPVEGL